MGLLRKKKQQKEETNQIEEKDYEHMLIWHRRRIVILVLVLIVIAIFALIGVKIYLDNRAYDTYEVSGTIDVGEVTNCKFYEFGDGLLRYSNDGISYMIGTDTVWNQAFEMKQPLLDICEDYMAIADLKGTKVYILNTTGLQGEISTTAPILDLEVARQGVVAAITQNDTTNLIEVYDKDGTNIAVGQTVLSGDGCPVDISLSNDGTKLMVSYIYLESSVAKTKVIFYNYSEVGKNEVGRIVGGFEHYDTTLISKVEFVTNDVAVAFGDDIISIYSIKQQPSLLKEISVENEIESIFYSDKYIGIVQKSEEMAEQYLLKVYDLNGKQILDKKVDFAYTDVQIKNDMVIFNNQEQMYVVSVDDILKYNGSINEGILKVIPTKLENHYTIITDENAEEIKLK
jgi:CII-binding regulator of phage lambda lysogenization HflD